VHALPASCGDCLWIEFGTGSNVKRVLVDGGKIATYAHLHEKVRSLPWDDSLIHLLVVTHVDADHIEGVIGLLTDRELRPGFGEIWFNGWPQFRDEATKTLGVTQGELLGALLARQWPSKWNYSWADQPRKAICRGLSDPIPVRTCEGMSFTLLSPDPPRVERIRRVWGTVMKQHSVTSGSIDNVIEVLQQRHRKLLRGPLLGEAGDEWQSLLKTHFATDTAINNGSSLAFLAEYQGMSCLLLGDAFPEVVHDALTKVANARCLRRVPVGLMKVSHHGSSDSTNDDLLDVIDCKHFLFSTDGSSYRHPDEECVVRIIERCGPEVHLYFNADHSSRNAIWNDADMRARHRFQVHYPVRTAPGIRVDVPYRG
jgi:hypothetical protein